MKPKSRNSKPLSLRPLGKPQGILVLGMHRSGTSALTRMLNLLGCDMPDDLIGPGDGNARGHWESVAAVTINDSILASAGSSWDDWGPLNLDWRASGLKADLSSKIQEVVEAHVATGPLFVLKDPRLCRLADLWFDSMDATGVEPLAILMLRNPVEVIESLESRDLMAPSYGQLLWLRHVLDAEFFSRGRKRVVCRYDQLMRSWHGVVDRIRSGLTVALPRNSPAVHAEIERFLSRELRHHELGLEASLDNPGLMAWLRRTFAILLDWSERGENPADHAELDQIREEFDQSYSVFAGLLLETGIAGSVGSGARLKRELDEQLILAQDTINAAQEQMRELEIKQAAAAAREVELTAKAEFGESRAGELEAQIAGLRAEADRLAPLEIEAAQLRERAGALEGDLGALTLRNAELNGQIETGNARTLELEAQIAGLRAEADRLAPLEIEAAQLRERAGTLEADLAVVQTALEAATKETEQERNERQAIEAKLVTAQANLHEEALRNAELSGRSSAIESALVQRQEELAQVWDQLVAAEKARSAAEASAVQLAERRVDAEKRLLAAEASFAELKERLDNVSTVPVSNPVEDQLYAEMAQMTQLLLEQETALQSANQAKRAAEQELAQRSAENSELAAHLEEQKLARQAAESARVSTEEKLASRFDEIARLTAMLGEECERAVSLQSDSDWLREMAALSQMFPTWWLLLPYAWRKKREHGRYKRAGLFDAQAYLVAYPDVVVDGMDPVRHYILHGMAEGRTRPT